MSESLDKSDIVKIITLIRVNFENAYPSLFLPQGRVSRPIYRILLLQAHGLGRDYTQNRHLLLHRAELEKGSNQNCNESRP